QQGNAIADAQRNMFVVDVPQRVVAYFQGDKVPYGAVGEGARGSQILELSKALQDVHDGFGRIASGFRLMASGIDSAQIGLEGVDERHRQARAASGVQKVDVSRQAAVAGIGLAVTAINGIISGVATAGLTVPSSGIEAATQLVNLNAAMAQADILDQRAVLAG